MYRIPDNRVFLLSARLLTQHYTLQISKEERQYESYCD